MEPEFTNEQAKEMYQILVEIHDGLKTLKNSQGRKGKLNIYETVWFAGLDEILKSYTSADPCPLPSKMKVVAILNQVDGLVAIGDVHPLNQTKKIAELLGLAHLKIFGDPVIDTVAEQVK